MVGELMRLHSANKTHTYDIQAIVTLTHSAVKRDEVLLLLLLLLRIVISDPSSP